MGNTQGSYTDGWGATANALTPCPLGFFCEVKPSESIGALELLLNCECCLGWAGWSVWTHCVPSRHRAWHRVPDLLYKLHSGQGLCCLHCL